MKLFSSLRSSPIESLCAFVFVAVGIYVSSVGSSATQDKTGLLTAGGLLTTFGGILFAWVVSKAFASAEAREEFQQQLGHLSRNLGQAAGQISRAVEQSQSKDISSESGLALISQANRMIYGQVSEISVIQGTGFDSAYLLETATTLDGLARQLESGGSEADELKSVRRQLQEVRTSLAKAPSRTFSGVTLACPHCLSINEVELGDFPGDTASVACAACGVKFNAHRSSDGSAFSRPAGPAAKTPSSAVRERWTFACPSCERQMSTWTGEGEARLVCFDCDRPIIVDREEQTARLGEGTYSRGVGAIEGKQGSRPTVRCVKCGTKLNAFLQAGDSFLGVCHGDRQIMEVSRADFERWDRGLVSPGSAAGMEGRDGTPESALPSEAVSL